MKVKDIIANLTERYSPDDELIITWWDRNLFLVPDDLDETGHREPTCEEWDDAVATFDDTGWGDHIDMVLFDTVYELVRDAVEVTA